MKRSWVLAFFLFILLIGGNYILPAVALPVRFAHHVIMSGVLLWWIARRGLPNHPLAVPLYFLVSVVLMSAVSSPIDQRMALESAWGWLIHALLFLFLVDAVREGHGPALIDAAIAAGVLLAASMLIEAAIGNPRPSGIVGITNLAGGFLGLIVPLTWARHFDKSRPPDSYRSLRGLLRVAVDLLILGLPMLALFYNMSRGGMLAGMGGILLFFALEFKIRVKHLTIILVVIAVAYIGVAAISEMPGRASGDAFRLDLWRSALEMHRNNTMFGVGPGQFGYAYRFYGSDLPNITDNATGAHNLYLNICAELGTVGAIVAAAVVLIGASLIPQQRTTLQNGALAALVGCGAHMLVDNFPATNYAALVALLAAIVLADARVELPRQLARTGRIMAAGAVGIFALFLVRADAAQYFYERSLTGREPEAIERAIELDPAMSLYRIQRARVRGQTPELPTVDQDTDVTMYAMVRWNRYWR